MTLPDDSPTENNNHPPNSPAVSEASSVPVIPVSAPDDQPPEISHDEPKLTTSAQEALPALPFDTTNAINTALAFLATASPEALAAIGVGATFVLYVVFGRLGLLLVGLIAGAVGQAALSNSSPKKDGSDITQSLKNWIDTKGKIEDGERTVVQKSRRKADFSSLPPETAKAMEELTDAVIRDYVRWWYSPLLPQDDNFPNSCRNMLVNTLLHMHAHLSQKRSADTFMLFLVSTSNTFIVFLRELAAAAQSSLGTYIEEQPNSALAQMLDNSIQRRRLRMAADDVVQSFVGKEAVECEPVRIFLTEILAGVVLEMTVDKCSKPDWINELLVYLLEEETQPEILQKIDIGEATAVAKEDGAAKEKEKRMSRAEDEMKRAMEEAQEMTRMIEEETRRKSIQSTSNSTARSSLENGRAKPPDRLPAESSSPQSESFTSFDQIVPPANTPPAPPADILTKARVSLSDLTPDNGPPDKVLRSKPNSAIYLLQIEPASSIVSGWIVTRKYIDFETLHEVLRRISVVSGVDYFTRTHTEVPSWRGKTKELLRISLEQYLNDALADRGLAECEGMKRFLEKETGTAAAKNAGAFGALGKGWPNPTAFAKMGEGVLDVLSKAPQGVAQGVTEGGKGLFGGVKRVWSTQPKGDMSSPRPSTPQDRQSIDNRRSIESFQSDRLSTIERTTSIPPRLSEEVRDQHSRSASREGSMLQLELPQNGDGDDLPGFVSLPPPPSDMPDDYESDMAVMPAAGSHPPPSRVPPPPPPSDLAPTPELPPPPPTEPPEPPKEKHKPSEPLSTAETQFIVEILFALLSELYNLSSAWTLRRSLLNVARSILLRPGNASLENIRVLIQETVIESNTTDEAVAGIIRSVRKNAFPTEEELKEWEAQPQGIKGAELREKARKLVLAKGVPEALRGVMGAQASEECLGAVFDAVQHEGVGRGVVGGLVLEGVRGVCQ